MSSREKEWVTIWKARGRHPRSSFYSVITTEKDTTPFLRFSLGRIMEQVHVLTPSSPWMQICVRHWCSSSLYQIYFLWYFCKHIQHQYSSLKCVENFHLSYMHIKQNPKKTACHILGALQASLSSTVSASAVKNQTINKNSEHFIVYYHK